MPLVSRSHVVALAGALLTAGTMLAACGGSTAGRASSAGRASAPAIPAGYPVTVSDCGQSVTFDGPPTRAVSNDVNTTEDMLALGLQTHMVGDFGVDGDGPVGKPVPEEYLTAFHQVRDVSTNYFTLEQLVGLRPDFLFAGWNYGLQVGTNLTPDNLAKYGIKTLALSESCAHVDAAKQQVSIDDTYLDLTNLGKIFDVETKARQVIAGMQAQPGTRSIQGRPARR
jgi:iron complex transport system substrate-binding protein